MRACLLLRNEFHTARAILFAEGFAERSHAAVVAYLRERHKEFGAAKAHNFASAFVRKAAEALKLGKR